ncbi:hypothetical protein F4778DRAFT_713771 [Xylariomycetidae sp. FL2044]|nr:hypothetical protein F4778DRAFT_713771 [Xylariomycetidae sp. FL2044]
MEVEQGPWQKLDPSKLAREAEAKEAKLKRKQQQRLERAEARKEKRHAKSEAKQLRKLNVTRAAKWTQERKAADKLKKAANRPHKQEKHHRRMRQRAEKLEAQAKKLWADAQKARARADYLDKLKEQEEAVKNKLSNEIQQMAADPENDDYIPLDVPVSESNGAGSNAYSEKETKQQRRKDAKTQVKVLDHIMREELGPSITESGLHIEAEKEKKQKRKEEKRKKKAEEKAAREPDEVDGTPEDTETPKKSKKRKLEPANDDDEDDGGAPVGDDKKEKKKRKKEKKEKEKKSKKEREPAEEYVPSPADQGRASTDAGEQWNVSALEGGDQRRDKFLKLLGAKKSNGVAAADGHHAPASSKSNIAQMQSDLERQFDAGMKMKHDGHGHRRGLGA